MNFLGELIGKSEQEKIECIQARLAMLNNTSKIEEEFEKIKTYSGFIPDNFKIKISDVDIMGYSMKGIDYIEYMRYLEATNIRPTNKLSILSATITYVTNYFKFDIYGESKDKRHKIISNEYSKNGIETFFDLIETSYVPSIEIFKENGYAMCLEHAALMQNLLTFLGEEITIILAVGINEERKHFGHAFNIIHIQNADTKIHLYVDIVKKEIKKQNGKTIILPALKIISDEDYLKLINGESLTISTENIFKKSGHDISAYALKGTQNAFSFINNSLTGHKK